MAENIYMYTWTPSDVNVDTYGAEIDYIGRHQVNYRNELLPAGHIIHKWETQYLVNPHEPLRYGDKRIPRLEPNTDYVVYTDMEVYPEKSVGLAVKLLDSDHSLVCQHVTLSGELTFNSLDTRNYEIDLVKYNIDFIKFHSLLLIPLNLSKKYDIEFHASEGYFDLITRLDTNKCVHKKLTILKDYRSVCDLVSIKDDGYQHIRVIFVDETTNAKNVQSFLQRSESSQAKKLDEGINIEAKGIKANKILKELLKKD